MKLKANERVSLPEAKRRALVALRRHDPLPASVIADKIWPGHRMKAQGAGAAAVRILKHLEREGLARWEHKRYPREAWGWIRTGRQ